MKVEAFPCQNVTLYISNVHEGKISFPCQICGKAFVVKHSRVHESASLPMSCQNVTLCISNVHEGRIGFPCQICGKDLLELRASWE